jgi:hypothetical protein
MHEITFNRVVWLEINATLTSLHFLHNFIVYSENVPCALATLNFSDFLLSYFKVGLVETKLNERGALANNWPVLDISLPCDGIVGDDAGLDFDGFGVPLYKAKMYMIAMGARDFQTG